MIENPSCFLSYSWDSDAHRHWVRGLAKRLQDGGVVTKLDQWDVVPGADVLHYMESAVRESDYVLLICTPTFAVKANAGKGGVGYEKAIVGAEVFANAHTEKFIPILRAGVPAEALPSYIRSRVFIDFTDDARFESSLEDLLRVLHRKPLFERPPLGPVPELRIGSGGGSNSSKATLDDMKQAFKFAWTPEGLNLPTRDEALAWSERWFKEGHTVGELVQFKEVFEFAYGAQGLNLASRQEALKWAETWHGSHGHDALGPLKEAFAFAYNPDGLNLASRQEALEWALKRVSV